MSLLRYLRCHSHSVVANVMCVCNSFCAGTLTILAIEGFTHAPSRIVSKQEVLLAVREGAAIFAVHEETGVVLHVVIDGFYSVRNENRGKRCKFTQGAAVGGLWS